MNKPTYQIVASPTFKLTLTRLCHFLEKKYSAQKARETKQILKKTLLENLPANPTIAAVSNRLLDLGITNYRQYLIDQHNLVFYRIDERQHKVTLLAVMDNRQSIQKLLQEIVLQV